MASYQYTPLSSRDEIRVLRILSGNNAPLQVELIHVNYHDEWYEALSYCWGDRNSTIPIQIRVQRSEEWRYEMFSVTTNLFMALRALSTPYHTIDLWVDAICIDQCNDDEKRVQVAMMEKIYRRARRVAIWLGQGPSPADVAFPFIQKIVEACSSGESESLLEPSFPTEWQAFVEVMKNPWFSRRWVIQELALAKEANLHSAGLSVSWDDFATAVAFYVFAYPQSKAMHDDGASDDVPAPSAIRLVDIINKLFREDEGGDIAEYRLTLEDLVLALAHYKASDPRDFIYAVLSLAKDIPRPGISLTNDSPKSHGISPDYSKCLMNVCKDFVQYSVQSTGSLDIICRRWAPPGDSSMDRRLASWVQSEKHPSVEYNVSLVGRDANHRFYNAAQSIPPKVKFGANIMPHISQAAVPDISKNITELASARLDRTLIATGIWVDTIHVITRYSSDGRIAKDWLNVGGFVDYYGFRGGNSAPVMDELWRTLVADRGTNGTNPPRWYRLACQHIVTKSRESGIIDTRRLIKDGNDRIVLEYLKRMTEVVSGRSLFRSWGGPGSKLEQAASFLAPDRPHKLDGYDYTPNYDFSPIWKDRLGLAPADAKKGDIVCVLFGCSVPVVLRPLPLRRGYFNLIGECYLDGMMDGEAISSINKFNLSTEEFTIQ